MIKISTPIFGKQEEAAVTKVLRSGLLAQGKNVALFEKNFANFMEVRHGVATSNGTAALHLALLALGIGKGDEVITTSFSFVASTTAILHSGAKAVFVDIDPKTFNLDPSKIVEKITPRTKAILVVHLYGLPANMEEISKISKKYRLVIIEDACQAHGAAIDQKKVGTFGQIGCFSFYPTKNMTTGEGGMIITNNTALVDRARLLREHGMKKHYHHEILGFNYRMTELSAAIGIEQLKKLAKFNSKRIANAKFMTKQLSKVPQVKTPFVPKGFTHVFHQYTIQLPDKRTRDGLYKFLNQDGIGASIYYPIPIHKQKFLLPEYPGLKLEVTEELVNRVLSLPVHPLLTKCDLLKIAKLIKKFFKAS